MRESAATLEQVLADSDCLHDEAAVRAAVRRLAAAINRDYHGRRPVVLVVMNGGLVPAGWLLPEFRFLCEVDYLHATRYRGRTIGEELHWLAEPRKPLRDRDVLLIDDILDEGITLREIVRWCRQHGPRSVRSVVLAKKLLGRDAAIEADYVGLEVENRYVFGCGMDYHEYFRNLAAIHAVKNDN